MAKTPLLQTPRKQSATLYVFPSAQEDIGLNLNFRANSISLSHYALLDIPQTAEFSEGNKNSLVLTAITDHFNTAKKITGGTGVNSNDLPGVHLAMSLQNYMMNFETLLINQKSYDFSDLHTVSERVFWKWLKEVLAIRWKYANAKKSFIVEDIDGDAVFNDSASAYKRVVKCFGAIDSGNSAGNSFGIYNETYVTVPTSYGSGPVFFKIYEDENYRLGNAYLCTNVGGAVNYLEGRSEKDSYMSHLGSGMDIPFTDKSSAWCGSSLTNNGYMTQSAPSSNDDKNAETNTGDGKRALRSNFDGIEIVKDFSEMNVMRDGMYDEIMSYDQLNISDTFSPAPSFKFNAILLYYSVYDTNSSRSAASSVNAFGIVFLDSPVSSGTNTGGKVSFYIPEIEKKKSLSGSFGGGYSFRVNIKSNSVYDNTDAFIDDRTSGSALVAEDFNSVIKSLNESVEHIKDIVESTALMRKEYVNVMNLLSSVQAKQSDLEKKLNTLLDYSIDEKFRSVDSSSIITGDIYNKNYMPEDSISLECISDPSTILSDNLRVYEGMNTSIGMFSKIDIVADSSTGKLVINPESALFKDPVAQQLGLLLLNDRGEIEGINYMKMIPAMIAWIKNEMNSSVR